MVSSGESVALDPRWLLPLGLVLISYSNLTPGRYRLGWNLGCERTGTLHVDDSAPGPLRLFLLVTPK